ncbi:LuxE/PaaK family acyltransferase [Membranihabitans maritimus]|uniref:LuxE/PaaK family acyltransferase n=1 Tax=Membranihabitans maritimus TaxID=2904244 RepID=UPI001F3A85E7|nr:acyl transferase [Membranihabitans maritimus]
MPIRSKRKYIKDKITSFEFDFDDLAGSVFEFQYNNNSLYRQYCDYLGRIPGKINSLENIPFLPISFFKSHEIVSGTFDAEVVFKSSGTTREQRSQHFVRDSGLYKTVSIKLFEDVFGDLSQFCILALLPNYLEQGDSSLVYMVDLFIHKSGNKNSRFFKYNFEELVKETERLKSKGEKLLIIGVSYALQDLAEKWEIDWHNHIVLETGGMKGRKKEMLRAELHDVLGKRFNKMEIGSEYGMTELLSQLYSKGNGAFDFGQTIRPLPFEINDPFTREGPNRVGRCHIIDLANLDSCSFIATEDLCSVNEYDSIKILGRMDHSEVRGCNLLYTHS